MIRILLLIICMLAGCASVENVDRSYVNHPAMDLKNKLTPDPKGPLTNLGSVGQVSSGGTCASCAH